MTSVGRPYRSAMRPATMPMTPGCHESAARTMAAPRWRSSATICSRASARILPLESLSLDILIFEKAAPVHGALGRRRCQQIDDEPCAAEPAGGVQSRGDSEGNVLGANADAGSIFAVSNNARMPGVGAF